MKKIILILSCTLCLISCTLNVNSQNLCPNLFKCGDTLIDPRDGFKYPTVQIGTQCWFTVSMHATKYLNGDEIPNVPDPTTWYNLSTGAWCDYNNDPANGVIYGHMYNWFAGVDSRGLCPRGWYVPSENDWTVLNNYLGPSTSGTQMKANSSLWSTNTGTNSSGFNGLPDGYRDSWDGFAFKGNVGHFWSSTPSSGGGVGDCALQDVDPNAHVDNGSGPQAGFSWRCMKNY